MDLFTGALRSHLAADPRVVCDASDPEYRELRRTAFIMIGCTSALPLVYFLLLFKAPDLSRSRHDLHDPAVIQSARSDLA